MGNGCERARHLQVAPGFRPYGDGMSEMSSAVRTGSSSPGARPLDLSADVGPPRIDAALGRLAVVGALTSAVVILALDLFTGSGLVRGRGLRSLTISEYVYTDFGWAFALGVIALSAGSAALWLALLRTRRLRAGSPASVLLAFWAIGLAAIVVFPKHDWSVGPSTSGSIHRVASLVAFIALPIAVLLIAGRRQRRKSWAASAAFGLALGGLAFLGVLLGAVVVGGITGGSWWRIIPLGLIERGLVGFEVAAVLAMGIWVIRGDRRSAAR